MEERTLSVFVDESGRFQCPDIASRFYIISLVLHDQSSKIDEAVRGLDTSFRAMHLNNVCFHAGPLIRQEKIYAVLDWEFRYRIFAAMMAFARKADFKYHCLIVDKKFCNTPDQIVKKLGTLLSDFINGNSYDFGQFDRIKVYYDCGQAPVTNLLHRNFVAKPGLKIEFAQAVKPEKYRLFQLADLVCTLKLIETRLCNNLPMTDSEYTLFGGPRKFKRSILKFIKQKEI